MHEMPGTCINEIKELLHKTYKGRDTQITKSTQKKKKKFTQNTQNMKVHEQEVAKCITVVQDLLH